MVIWRFYVRFREAKCGLGVVSGCAPGGGEASQMSLESRFRSISGRQSKQMSSRDFSKARGSSEWHANREGGEAAQVFRLTAEAWRGDFDAFSVGFRCWRGGREGPRGILSRARGETGCRSGLRALDSI